MNFTNNLAKKIIVILEPDLSRNLPKMKLSSQLNRKERFNGINSGAHSHTQYKLREVYNPNLSGNLIKKELSL